MDLDGFGASLGMATILKKYQKEAEIIVNLDEQETSIKKAMEIIQNKNYKFLESSMIHEVEPNSLLIILDVHKKEMLEIPSFIEKAKEIIIVDHHIKRNCVVGNINLLEPSISSTVEIIIDYLKEENLTIDSLTATIMLAGIYIDTNAFNIKTTDQTFESAAYLMRNKADNILKQELFQEDMQSIIKRQKWLKNSYKINDNMMICTLDKNIYKKSDLAKLAEEILQFQDVEASFSIGYIEKDIIGISARSIGKIDVEKIMKQLGGGGHKTDAACKLENITIDEAKQQLENILR